MSDTPESGEKTHDPTPKKLLDARKDGQVPKSTDLSAAAAYLGLIPALEILGSTSLLDAATKLTGLLSAPEDFARTAFAPDSTLIKGLLGSVAIATLLPLFTIPAVAVLVSLIAQNAITFAPRKIQPKWSMAAWRRTPIHVLQK